MSSPLTAESWGTGILARVTAIGEDGCVCFDRRDGKSGYFDPVGAEYSVGDVLLLPEENHGEVRRVPYTAWPEALWVGVVKIRLEDTTVVESGGRLRTVPSVTDPPYEVGYTVEAADIRGVVRVLSEKPVSILSMPELDDSFIERFRATTDEHLDFADFGGLSAVVARARELIEIPLRRAEALAKMGARPVRGVLFTGPPGTGKTMLARIIAARAEAAFYEVSGPEIFSKWYGQSEEVLRRIFDAAKRDKRAMVFFDEIDSVAAQRDDQSHEASKRVVTQLLTLMDGFKANQNLVVIAATNRPQDLDVALRRPGRFDWEIEFPYPDESDRRDILEKSSQGLETYGQLPHDAVAADSRGWSAAELTQIWTEAALLSVADDRSEIRDEDYVGGFERVRRYRGRAGKPRDIRDN